MDEIRGRSGAYVPIAGKGESPRVITSRERTMNKSELIKHLSEARDLHVDEASDIVNAFIESIKQALVNDDRVEIRGFGSFKIKSYKGYTGRNPKSGDVVTVAPKKLPFFRPGKELKEYINQ
jgi:integration host factor subunit beta